MCHSLEMGHIKKGVSQLEKRVRFSKKKFYSWKFESHLKNVSQLEKWVHLKNVSRLKKITHSLINGSHLKLSLQLEK